LRQVITPWTQALLDMLYPRTCRVCDVPLVDRNWLCKPCEDALPTLDAPFCQVCGEPFAGMIDREFRCENCADRKLYFDFAIAGYKAEGEVRELVHRFKYGRDVTLRAPLGHLLRRQRLDLGDEHLLMSEGSSINELIESVFHLGNRKHLHMIHCRPELRLR
jgi:predicted amidophosphoribosyltransferase